ncbi:hypothetical protein DDZ18_12500 [Marinicauda salina]|uniref:DUF819 family protein n=1 Tax=Marinicauda salina TaxID=2135793 RepID=A0A2U2BRD9_9PROT|nr:DUF819 family protein [Marinicauda salina]PWE16581.1 hypothetical protein DDZ18_12500 [Marinicauda salina]
MDDAASATLIPAGNHMAVMAALFAVAMFGFLMEKTKIGALLTGAVWAILGAILLANLRVIPHDAPAYGFVFDYFVPVLIPLFLFKADLKRIFFETGRMAGAFMLAALGTTVGVVIAMLLLDFGAREPGVAGAFTATYVGGSVNYAALLDMTGLREDESFVAAATAVDNMASALFLAVLAVLPGWAWLARRFPAIDHTQGDDDPEVPEGTPTAFTLTTVLALALIVVALADAIVFFGDRWVAANLPPAWDGLFSGYLRYVIITILALIPATAMPGRMAKLHGGYELGLGLAFVFFAAIAAGANIEAMIRQAPILIPMVAIILAGHALVVFGLGSVFRLSLPELITASNASILGATTAPALAAAKGWRDLVTPGVLVGVFGYALGTVLGSAVYGIWQALG